MNRKLLSIISLIFIVGVTGCGNDNSSTNKPSNSESNSVNQQVSSSSSIPSNLKEYKIEVVLENGEKAPQGIAVQLCVSAEIGGACYNAITDANGVAVLNLEEKDYDVHVTYEGYALENGVVVYASNPTLKVTLKKIINPSEGDGSLSNPFAISKGVYSTSIANSGESVYYHVNFTETGKYVVESWYAGGAVVVEPAVGSVDEGLHATVNDEVKGQNGSMYGNFSITFEISESQLNTPYLIGLTGTFRKGPKEYTFAVRSLAE